MFKKLKKAFKFIFRKKTLSHAGFILNIVKTLYGDEKGNNSKRNKQIIEKVEFVQEQLDKIHKYMPNSETSEAVSKINMDLDTNRFGNFTAKVSKNKHGDGNNGIDVGWSANIKKIPIKLGYNPLDGGADVQIGPFKLKF